MRRETSLYLDAARFLAAFVVFIGHVGSGSIGGGLGWQLTPYGAPAVVIFFVLSGFVIGYVSHEREKSGRDYVIARGARLYSVIVPTLVLTALLDYVGTLVSPSLYATWSPLLGSGGWHLPVSLLFLNETWGAHILPGSNGAYWSLSYEAAYYAIFGLVFYLRGITRILVPVAIALVAGPQIVALLPVWLTGWAAYHACTRWTIGRRLGWLLFFGSIIVAIGADFWARRYGMLAGFQALFDHGPAELAQDYVLGLIFAVNLLGFNAIGPVFSGIVQRISAPIRWLSGATFTLYLLHVPLVLCVRALFQAVESSVISEAAILVIPFVGALAIAHVTERKKNVWKQLIERMVILITSSTVTMRRGTALRTEPPLSPARAEGGD
ncbi:acyltransferase [Siccirubricoccus sp. G192]|uniref:acyltransferase family protein n=1 Tax=Siccirubricoccus sp. G192 TaxID=2849651 RepID=UPI001C2B9BDB|nr:acyltransferase [Siccirubricoccus sp. G192]MBV1796360.1 acyltransferase [Siccirubricoccus sp. G192]